MANLLTKIHSYELQTIVIFMFSLTCAICNHHRHQLLYSLDEGALVTCQKCRVVAFSPRPTAEELKAFYDDYHDNFSKSTMADSNFAQQRYRELEECLQRYALKLAKKTEKTLLDIGCGTGNFLQVAQKAGWQITGTEIASRATSLASQNVGNHILQGDIVDLDLPTSSYDLITNYHVIEHLLDPVAQLQRCHELLAPDGILFIETPNIQSLGSKIKGKNWSHIIPPEHIIYFSPASLKYALEQAGFKQFFVRTSAPQVVESIAQWPLVLRRFASLAYQIAPRVGLGAAVQAIAIKHVD